MGAHVLTAEDMSMENPDIKYSKLSLQFSVTVSLLSEKLYTGTFEDNPEVLYPI